MIIHLGVNIRILLEEEVAYLRTKEIHIGPEIVVHRRDIAPIIGHLVTADALHIFVAHQYIIDKIKSVFLDTPLDHLDEQPASHNIYSAGNGIRLRNNRFFFKFFNPVVLTDLDRSESFQRNIVRHILADYCYISFLVDMIL